MSTEERIYKHEELTGRIIKVFYEVYNELGFGFLEQVYQRAMAIALADARICFVREAPIGVWFRGENVGTFQADFLVEECVIVELKAVREFDPAHEAQLLNYLRATDVEVGLLLNFGPKPQIKRLAFDNARKNSHRS